MYLNKLSVNKIRTELWTCHILSEQRCLDKACEWVDELVMVLPEEGEEKLLAKLDKELNDPGGGFNSQLEDARMCFENAEYDRAAHMIRLQKDNDVSRFLHYFAKYKAAEKKRIDLMGEVTVNIPKRSLLKFNELRDSLERSMDEKDPDGWLLYVYGLVLYKFRLHKLAINALVKSINMTPINWSAWHMLSLLIDCKEQLHSLDLPDHQFKVFFYYMMRLEFDMEDEDPWVLVSAKNSKHYIDTYFKNSPFIQTLMAKNISRKPHRHGEALELFAKIRKEDPYRLEGMDIYSNILYVQKMRREMTKLAYDVEKVDPMTAEANSCIANSYSLREKHTKAIVYFTRALRIDPDSSNAWTLIGHEYLELKSVDKAIQAYRFATMINKRDCRAWLGLGNAYETMNSSPGVATPNYDHSLYYFSQVAKYRPKDQTMFVAMGSIYEKLGDITHAIICFKKAGQRGHFKLAKLYESNNMRDEAAELSLYLS